ncbi:MAG: amino acid permease [Verrucomicrobia bacterium]|nr:amino acid permease [Cytophagales bacterium]
MKFNTFFRKKSVETLIADANHENAHGGLVKSFTVTDLTLFGIAAIIGGGVFSTIGSAAYNGGTAIAVLYSGFAVACIFSAYCYARFASVVPVSGSAYTYAYTSLGEIVAWILGWNLILEYAISNVVVAISWSDYFTTLLEGFHIYIPEHLSTGYFTARDAYLEAVAKNNAVSARTLDLRKLWETAPRIGNFPVIMDIPALAITVAITYLVFVGIRESKNVNNVLVLLKLAAVLLVIILGAFYVKPENWVPFAPHGISGVMAGVAAVSFAYIGFDSISTTAEECKNPQKDIPKAMMYSLIVCTVLYVATVFVMTGMVSYKELNVGDPLAYIFQKVDLNFVAGIVSVGAVIATTSAMLAYQIGQPRIWMVMSRDGLLPKIFSNVHPKFKTPSFATLVTGAVVGIPALFVDQSYVTDLTAIGTLFAFALVCGGVLMLDQKKVASKFKVPYVNAKFVMPILISLTFAGFFVLEKPATLDFLTFTNQRTVAAMETEIRLLSSENTASADEKVLGLKEELDKEKSKSAGKVTGESILKWMVLGLALTLAYLSFTKNLSLIPVLGVMLNGYLMTTLGTENWIRFIIWCAIGFAIYFFYSFRKSKLNP